ncbi:hypothetical protein LTR37_016901 [Vermiconidia calcicola]|uniref:Uncharacterized protein n=1 Tax=Vermiconidia calcicola TaxID=1690605 RepID=A0ACC3MLF8_9PEZI|nr:hypothetical protein LTR37_016901 [Vermiconidia calcicola]
MISIGTVTAPSICLRCQLRSIVFRTRKRSLPLCLARCTPNTAQGFAAYARRCQEAEEAQGLDRHGDGRGDEDRRRRLSQYPLGRIIGKPGRRQRESSARLKTDAMKKPFEVVLMRDVAEHKTKQAPVKGQTDLATYYGNEVVQEDSASEVFATGEEASQEEAEESIESLRPDTTVLDKHQYDYLIKQLREAYNAKQLSLYLTKALKLSSIDGEHVHVIPQASAKSVDRLSTTPWQPGKTPIEQRARRGEVLSKSEMGKNKSKLAQQILRLAWSLTVHSDEQSVGELEVYLKRWQVRYLFDLNSNGMPMYQAMIDTPLLRRTSEVRPYRSDNVMRITARRQDAEEIAAQIEHNLRSVESLEVDLTVFKQLVGTPGWPRKLSMLFDDALLKSVERTTTTTVERYDEKTLLIWGRSLTFRQHARRILLSLLELPSPSLYRDIVMDPTEANNRPIRHVQRRILVPDSSCSALHLRYRNLRLGRLEMASVQNLASSNAAILPKTHITNGVGADPLQRNLDDLRDPADTVADALTGPDAKDLAKRLSAMEPFAPYPGVPKQAGQPTGTWHSPLQPRTWNVQFCKVLRQSRAQADITTPDPLLQSHIFKALPRFHPLNEQEASVLQPQVPGLSTLLEFFSPKPGPRPHGTSGPNTEDLNFVSGPFLVAHFIPSPLTRTGIHAMRSFPRIEIAYKVVNGLKPVRMTAKIATQQLGVLLPHEAVDLCFDRTTLLKNNRLEPFEQPEVQRFTHTLRESFESGSGVLAADPAIKLKLPAWLASQHKNRKQDVEIDYLFDRFEQVSSADFIKDEGGATSVDDPIMREVLEGMPKGSYLTYNEVEGGAVGGSRSELHLMLDWFEAKAKGEFASHPSAVRAQEEPVHRAEHEGAVMGDAAEQPSMGLDLRLVKTGLGLAHALTRISAGQLKSPSAVEAERAGQRNAMERRRAEEL